MIRNERMVPRGGKPEDPGKPADPGKPVKPVKPVPDAVLERARVKAQRVADAVAAWRTAHGPGSVVTVTTRRGVVRIADVTVNIPPGKQKRPAAVEVRLDGAPPGGEPHFRIVNPPSLVPDPAGDIVVTHPKTGQTRRFRDDPLAALAAVIARHGGAAAGKGGRR